MSGGVVGRNLSHYEVLEELGRGGMGVVYKARDTTLNRLVALKLLPPELADDPRRVALLQREARASAKLNHPRIVTLYTVEEDDGQLFLTMEYVDGQTLDRVIPKGGFKLDRFLRIAIPLADALATAHDNKIVHRDLKPGNIILSKEDRPKILDFGLARLRPDESTGYALGGEGPARSDAITQMETLDGRMAGTLAYMSPEQLSRRAVDHRTDIFSLGIVLYEMATGRHPYRSSDSAISASILQSHPDSVADVRAELPRQLGRIIRRCLEKDPGERIQSAKDLRNALADLERELSVSGGERTDRKPRHRLGTPMLVLVALLLLATSAWLLYDRFFSDASPATPYQLALEEHRVFPGDRGPEYYRLGVLEALRRQLAGLNRIYLVGADGPLPDIVVQVDARRAGDTIHISSRIMDSRREVELSGRVLKGTTAEVLALVQQAGRAIANDLGEELDQPIAFRPAQMPTRDAAALDLYMRASAAVGPEGRPVDVDGVHRLLRQALERDGSFSWAHLLEGQTRLSEHGTRPERGMAARAETHCRAAAESDPELGPAHTCLGDALLLQGRALDAVEAYRRAIEVDTSDLRPHYGLRDAFLDLGLPETAERTWQELIGEHPDYWAGYYSLGTYYQDSNRYLEALEQYDRALTLAPRNPDLHSYLGTVYFYLGRFEEAIVSLQRSIEIRPGWDAHYDLGGIYFSLRRFEAAVSAFENAVELAESTYRAAHSHGRLGWATYWVPGRREQAQGHLEHAIELSKTRLESHPDDSDTMILAALYQALIGDQEASRQSVARALDLRPNDPHYFYLAGLALNHLGDTEAAVDWLRRAAQGGYSIAEIRNIVDLENLHTDPRFQQILREADPGRP